MQHTHSLSWMFSFRMFIWEQTDREGKLQRITPRRFLPRFSREIQLNERFSNYRHKCGVWVKRDKQWWEWIIRNEHSQIEIVESVHSSAYLMMELFCFPGSSRSETVSSVMNKTLRVLPFQENKQWRGGPMSYQPFYSLLFHKSSIFKKRPVESSSGYFVTSGQSLRMIWALITPNN